MATRKTKEPVKTEPRFYKSHLLASDRYAGKRDLINVLLVADESYTLKEVDKMINDYMKGTVI